MTKLIKTKKTPEQLAIEQAKDDKPSQNDTLVDMPITEHLIELRRHLIHGFAAVLVIFLALAGFSREILRYFFRPVNGVAARQFFYDCNRYHLVIFGTD